MPMVVDVPARLDPGAAVTTTMPYRPIGPWMEGWVPDSSRYVPGGGAFQVRVHGEAHWVPVTRLPGVSTSVENDWTRVPWVGGLNTAPPLAAGQVVPRFSCVGLAVEVAVDPKPPPSCPTITSDVGMLLNAPVALGNVTGIVRLLVRLITRSEPLGTVMTTGDQLLGATVPAFSGLQVAPVEAPQK